MNFVRGLLLLGFIYCIAHWAVHNPNSAKSMVSKVDAAVIWVSDIISEKLFDTNEGA